MSDNEILSPAQQRLVDIQRACAIAGCARKAGQFISQGRDVGSVLSLLLKQKIAADERAQAISPEKPAVDLHHRQPIASSTSASWAKAVALVEQQRASGIVSER